jgi:hypothetical protein
MKNLLGGFLIGLGFMGGLELYAAVYRVIHYGWGAF